MCARSHKYISRRHLEKEWCKPDLHAGADPRERDSPKPVLDAQVERRPVATPEQFFALGFFAPSKDGSDRVRDVRRRQAVSSREFRLARFRAVQLAASGQQLWTGGVVDRTVDWFREEGQ